MRATPLILVLCCGAAWADTDSGDWSDTDTDAPADSGDTDPAVDSGDTAETDVVSDVDGALASEILGEEGGPACSTGATGPVPWWVAGVALTGLLRRRR